MGSAGASILNGTLDNTGQTQDLGALLPGTLELGTGGVIVGDNWWIDRDELRARLPVN